MRIDQQVDPTQAQTIALQHRIAAPPPVAVRRVTAIGQASAGEDTPKVAGKAPSDGAVMLDLSPEGREAARKAAIEELQRKQAAADAAAPAAPAEEDQPQAESPDAEKNEERVAELAERDGEVRAHEQAVRAMAGSRGVHGATYSYQVGPDGRLYVVEGELSFDTTEIPGDPEATLHKAENLQRALTSGKGTPEDRAAAALAAAMAARARHELDRQKREK